MTVHDSGPTGSAGPSEAGPLGDEAAKLAEALQYWASERLLPMAEEFGGSEECAVCPICRFMALVRGERPEVMAHLSDAAGALAAAVAAAVAPRENAAESAEDVPGPDTSPDVGDEPMSAAG